MKKLAILLVMVFAWIGISSATSEGMASKSKDGPTAVFKKRTYDFGTIKEADGPVSCEFAFTNTGNAPLIIISANAGCGCTQPAFDEAPILPGKSSVIKVTYNPKGRPGEFSKNITVRTNAPDARKVSLKIKGMVIPENH